MDGPLPDYELRQHALAAAVRAAEAELIAHGYPEPDRSLEVIAYAIDEAWAESEDDDDPLVQ